MAQVYLRGLTWDDPRGRGPLRAVHKAFCAAHPEMPIAIEWDIQPLAGFESRSLSELVEVYDLVVADHPHVLEAARHGCLVAIGEVDDDFVGPSRASYELDGQCWAAPVDAACHVSAYRPDAWENRKQPPIPMTWEEVERQAAAGLRVAVPLAGVHSTMALLSLIASRPERAGEQVITLTESGTKAALEQLHRIVQVASPRCLEWNPLQALNALANDSVDYVPLTFGYAHYEMRGIQFAPVPRVDVNHAGRGVVGGAGMAVSASSPYKREALAFAEFCSHQATQCDWWPNGGGQPAHRAAWDQLARHRAFYRDTREAMENAALRPRDLGFHLQQTALGKSIQKWLQLGPSSPPPDFSRLEQQQCAAAL